MSHLPPSINPESIRNQGTPNHIPNEISQEVETLAGAQCSVGNDRVWVLVGDSLRVAKSGDGSNRGSFHFSFPRYRTSKEKTPFKKRNNTSSREIDFLENQEGIYLFKQKSQPMETPKRSSQAFLLTHAGHARLDGPRKLRAPNRHGPLPALEVRRRRDRAEASRGHGDKWAAFLC